MRELVFRTIYSAKNAEHQLAAHVLGQCLAAHAGRGRRWPVEIHRAPGPLTRAYEYWVRRLAEREGRRADHAARNGCAPAAKSRGAAQRPKKSERRQGGEEEKQRGESDEVASIGCALHRAVALGVSQAAAQDTLKIAIGQINNWENQAPTLGEDAGIFKKHNLKIEAFGTQGAGETIQAVISGSADLGAGVGVAGVMRAFSQGRAGARARCRRSPAPATSTGT